jgi:regulator of sigma E protease
VSREGKELNLTVPEGFGNALLKQRGAFVMPRMPYIADSTRAGSAAAKVGVQPGDRLIAINGMDVPFYDQFAKEIKKHKSEDVIVSVVRGKDTLNLAAKLSEKGEFGVYPRLMLNLDTTKYTFFQALPAGVSESVDKLVSYVQQLRLIFVSKEVKVTESVGGFMTIGNLFPEMWDWRVFWEMTAFLSIVLAFMNILPIPGLDGGHVLFLLYEIVTGRKPNEKFMEYAQIAGMLILLSLLLFANGLDLWRNLLKKFF